MLTKQVLFDLAYQQINHYMSTSVSNGEKRYMICKFLKDSIKYYHWVGFYILDIKGKNVFLAEYLGNATEHVKIPVGVGVCGRVAQEQKTMIISDVSKENNYLSCSIEVKSEIVMPIFKDGQFVGELDVDSHDLAAFDSEDEEFLQKIVKIASVLF